MKRVLKQTKKRVAILALLLTFAISVSAQTQVQVQGTVVDEHGEPAIGATIRIHGTTQGTIADINGHFTILAPTDGSLVVSFIGYLDQTVPVGETAFVRLVLDAELLDEVVVIGYGTGRSITSTAASITRVSAAQLQNRPVANAMEALQGQVPGLQVFTSSGEPSATSSIRLHGAGSLNVTGEANAPLVVVDGMPVEQETLRALNPNDFQSVTILRDASATSIYGTRAANGVIFITTRRGTIGERGTVRISGNMGVSKMANSTLFDSMMTSDQLRAFRVAHGSESEEWADENRIKYPHNTRWEEVFFRRTAPTSTLNATISGGGGRTNYFISLGRTRQEGIAHRSQYDRNSIRANINSEVNSWLRTGLTMAVSQDNIQTHTPLVIVGLGAPLSFLNIPWFTPVDKQGNRHDWIPGLNIPHPEHWAENSINFIRNVFLTTTGFVELRPITGLTLRSQASLEGRYQRETHNTLPAFKGTPVLPAQRVLSHRSNITATNTAEYRFTVQDDHQFSLLAGTEYITQYFTSFWAGASMGFEFADDRLLLLHQLSIPPAQRMVGESRRESAFLSFFGRAEYDLKERYFLNLSLRNDASSRFGMQNRNGVFWSVGTMWHLYREEWLSNVSWLNELTARFSVGTSGNASFIGEYAHLATMLAGQAHEGEVSWNINLNSPGNPFLTWENQLLYSLGFNFGVLDRRVRGSVELYNRLTSSMLLNVPQPFTTGFATVTENAGRLANRGISFRIDSDVWRNNRGSFITPYITFNYNREEILELFNDQDFALVGGNIGWIVGQPRMHIRPLWAGVNPATGAPQWYLPYTRTDAFGNEVADMTRTRRDPNHVTSDFSAAALNQNTGLRWQAPINGGWGFSAGHRGFHLQTDFTFSLGRNIFLSDRNHTDNWNNYFNMRYIVNDFWREPGDVTRFPAADFQFTQLDSRLVEDASFMRLRNVTLGYVFPRNIVERTNFFSDMRVFVTGRNLLTWTNFSGNDPEFDGSMSGGMHPHTRQFSVGFDVSF